MYSPEIEKVLQKSRIKIGDTVRIEKDDSSYEGILMPKSAGDSDTLIVKLSNGYNMGVALPAKMHKVSEGAEKKFAKAGKTVEKTKNPGSGRPLISILSTGGTIASRVDYNTGGVTPLETPEEILKAVPELAGIANIRMSQVFQMFSEDMEPEHWVLLAERISHEISEIKPDGIIILHGTDTMHYTSAALAFMLQNLPVPVLLVGSQRSSDRGSSDASMNLLCAVQFIVKSDFAGVSICMHSSVSDDFCFVHDPVHVRKMHSSRRDAFRSIDVMPFAKVDTKGEIQYLRSDYMKRDMTRGVALAARFSRDVALIKIHPGFNAKLLDLPVRGIVLEGTGLGNAPTNVKDQYTEHHKELLEKIESLTKKGVLVAMTTQTIYGKVNMNVYSTGRDLMKAGVVPLAMTPEAAYVKLGWVLGHTRDSEDARKMLSKDVIGEFAQRIDDRAFLF